MTAPTEHDHRAALAANLSRIELPTYADAVLRLPVVPTCGECRHIWGEGAAGHTCTHERSNEGPVSPRAAPPSWCPMRGAR